MQPRCDVAERREFTDPLPGTAQHRQGSGVALPASSVVPAIPIAAFHAAASSRRSSQGSPYREVSGNLPDDVDSGLGGVDEGLCPNGIPKILLSGERRHVSQPRAGAIPASAAPRMPEAGGWGKMQFIGPNASVGGNLLVGQSVPTSRASHGGHAYTTSRDPPSRDRCGTSLTGFVIGSVPVSSAQACSGGNKLVPTGASPCSVCPRQFFKEHSSPARVSTPSPQMLKREVSYPPSFGVGRGQTATPFSPHSAQGF